MNPSSSVRHPCPAALHRRTWPRLRAIGIALSLAVANPAFAADADLARAGQLVQDGKYQEAYDLLAPFEEAARGDAAFNALLGQAALGTGRPDEAVKFFERSLAASPSSPEAHLGLGRAYLALGDYAGAKIEFETVLRFDDLPPDLHQQVEIYAAAARRYAAGTRVLPTAYAHVGVGNYRVNPTNAASGPGDSGDAFFEARAGGGMNYLLPGAYALVANLDVRYRAYVNDDRRNDADLRWNAAASHNMGEHNLAAGMRGRVRTFGTGTDNRNDWGGYANWRYRLDAEDQIAAGAEFVRRNYYGGPLQSEGRDIIDASGTWTRSMLDGKASFSLTADVGGEFATQGRIDGDAVFFGLAPTLNFTLFEPLGFFVTFFWQHYQFSGQRPGPGGGAAGTMTRYDNLWEAGAGLSWEFARAWTLNPEVLWVRDQSNVPAVNYSSTEIMITLRKDF
jgi:tetratricopeptide (TPR) repeat protein